MESCFAAVLVFGMYPLLSWKEHMLRGRARLLVAWENTDSAPSGGPQATRSLRGEVFERLGEVVLRAGLEP